MLRIERSVKKLQKLQTPSLAGADITERYDLQELIFNSPEEFFAEFGQKLFIIGKEIEPSENVQDRIDLLGVDPEGNAVIVELKRGNHKLHLLQALSYAGMISKWTPADFLARLDEDRAEALSDFLEVEKDDINRGQRVILIAEAFDYAVLVAAEWLAERHDVDVMCCRVSLATDPASNAEYLFCANVYPNPELAQQAVPRGRKPNGKGSLSKWPDWPTALGEISNAAVVDFFHRKLAAKRENYLPRRLLRYRLQGKRRYFVAAHKRHAYGWQTGRFDGDLKLWAKGLSDAESVQEVKDGTCLRFFLKTAKDFDYFSEAINKLNGVTWSVNSPDGDPDDPGEEP